MIAEGFTPTKGRKPRTGERKLRVQWRNGMVDRWEYTAGQLRWTDTGDSFDVVAVQMVDRPATSKPKRPANGSYE